MDGIVENVHFGLPAELLIGPTRAEGHTRATVGTSGRPRTREVGGSGLPGGDARSGRAIVSHWGAVVRPATFMFVILLCGCQGRGREEGISQAQDQLCSRGWWRDVTATEVEATLRVQGVSVNAACDDEDNKPAHLALSVEGILSESGFHGTAILVRAGADLSAVNEAGESAVSLAERRFQRMLRRWDADLEKLCRRVDVMEQTVQRERWENSMYYLVRTDSGLETLEEVRARTNARRERPPDCAG